MGASSTDPLDSYNLKRNFLKSREPAGKIGKGRGDRFVVHKHAARRLHYDLRLERDGVLMSWAVTRGPSLDPSDKRLAVRTEDHPLSYATFEGTIPKGEYGGGTVMLWDEGKWAPVDGKSKDDVERGHLHFILAGKRMKGEWLLVRMRPAKEDGRENWLLRKIADDYAGASDDLVARELTSLRTGRSMAEIEAEVPSRKSEKATGSTLPKFRKPQLATLVDEVPGGNGWLHEIKYDGYRCLLAVAGERVRIHTRSGKNWTDRFPEIAEAAAGLGLRSALIDGEIVKLDRQGNPSFSALQSALKNESRDLILFAFDLLDVDGEDLTESSTIERKERLGALIGRGEGVIRYSEHLIGAGEVLLDEMCKAGQEGIISKRADAPYRSRRTRAWLKIKCIRRQEFVIIGWRKSAKRGRPFASLLLAQHEDDHLVYKGRVGTGFDQDTMDDLAATMNRLARKSPPADVPRSDSRDASWITPRLVAEVAFSEFTSDDRVRHASFIGLRSDKEASEVRQETVEETPATSRASTQVTISNRDRVIFPDSRATKGDLADYYDGVSPLILPWLARRPVSLVRCPKGRGKKCFFQKHGAESFGDAVKAIPITEKDGGVEDYLYVEDAVGILGCVQMGTVEFHGWGSRIDTLEQPDRLVFDLDPDEGLDFADVKRAATKIRNTLSDLGLVSFAMLSGGKGVHVVVPLTPEAEWAEVKDFARRFATALARSEPSRFVATMSRAKRKGKIFIDWLRNQRGSTSILPYSVRARAKAPIAAPIAWDELREIDDAAHFTLDAAKLLERAQRPELRHWGEAKQALPDL